MKMYTMCLTCRSIQIRTDIKAYFGDKPYVFVNKGIMCHKCKAPKHFIATREKMNKVANILE